MHHIQTDQSDSFIQLLHLLQLPMAKLCWYCSVHANLFLAAIANDQLLVLFCGFLDDMALSLFLGLFTWSRSSLGTWGAVRRGDRLNFLPGDCSLGDCRRLTAKRRHFLHPPKGVKVPRRLSRHIKDGMPARHFGSTLKTKLNIEP